MGGMMPGRFGGVPQLFGSRPGFAPGNRLEQGEGGGWGSMEPGRGFLGTAPTGGLMGSLSAAAGPAGPPAIRPFDRVAMNRAAMAPPMPPTGGIDPSSGFVRPPATGGIEPLPPGIAQNMRGGPRRQPISVAEALKRKRQPGMRREGVTPGIPPPPMTY